MAKGPRAMSGRSAYERYYTAKAREAEMRNRQRQGELVDLTEAETRWGRIATEWATAAQNLAALAVQRGLIPREREAELQGLIDAELLERISGAPVEATLTA